MKSVSDMLESRGKVVLHTQLDQKASRTNSVERKTKEINTLKL